MEQLKRLQILVKGVTDKMIGLIQRVTSASVEIEAQKVAGIDKGILLLLGVEREDTAANLDKLLRKILNYRIFNDDSGKMNLSITDIQAELLVVSQFTLVADTAKGNRPGFSRGASPELGKTMFNEFVEKAKEQHQRVTAGVFGADMKISLINDGPVTFWLKA